MQINKFGAISAFNPLLHRNSIVIKSYGKLYAEAGPALPTSRTMKSIPAAKFGNRLEEGIIFFTKTEATRSDEEIKNDVIELAKKHGAFMEIKSPEYLELLKEYVSPHSPDRKAIFAKGADATQTEIKSRMSKPVIDVTPFQLSVIGKSTVESSYYYDWNKRIFDIGTVLFYENGENIGSYSGHHGWHTSMTEAERTRYVELGNIYKNAWEAERNSTAKTAANSAGFDFAAHNVSNQQNQTAQNTPAQQAISRYEQMQHAEHKK